MKKPQLDHSFDDVRLSSEEKERILEKLTLSGEHRQPGKMVRPVLAFAIAAALIVSIYLSYRFLRGPGNNGNGSPVTMAARESTQEALSVYYNELFQPYSGTSYLVSEENWLRIRDILSRAEERPEINGVTADLRVDDLYLRNSDPDFIFIRDYKEVYFMGKEQFKAYRLTESDSLILKDVLAGMMTETNRKEGTMVPPENEDLSKIPTLSLVHSVLSHLAESSNYQISPELWKKIAEVLTRAKYDPVINGVTEELRMTDIYLRNDTEESLFIRDYREIYLSGGSRFAGYNLSEEDATELKELFSQVMVAKSLLPEAKPAPEGPAGSVTLPVQSLEYDTIQYLMSGKEYSLGPDEWQAISGILGKAVHDPSIKGITRDLRLWDFHLLNGSDEYLYLRDFREIYLTDPNGFTAYTLSKEDSASLEKLLNPYMKDLSVPEGLIRPEEAKIELLSALNGSTPNTVLSDREKEDLNSILGFAVYRNALTMEELSGITSDMDLRTFLPDPEAGSQLIVQVSPTGDIFILTDLTKNMDSRGNFQFLLSDEMTLKLLDLIGLIDERAALY